MTHTIEAVVARGMCVGCGACSVRTAGAIPVTLGRHGVYEASLDGASAAERAVASAVCPFSDDAMNEDALADARFVGTRYDERVGYWSDAWAGRLADQDRLMGSSSGGLTSWLLEQLLKEDEIDAVLHVGRSPGGHFEYRVSTTAAQVVAERKSFYTSVTLADALTEATRAGVRLALVGVPCFIRAARLLAGEMTTIDQSVRYYVGLVCGHLKSQFFAESLAWQAGVAPDQLGTVDFRVKNPTRPSSDYDYSVTAQESVAPIARPMGQTIDGNWGYAAFQPEACNFCEDIFAETADVVFGDAWLPEYKADWRGTNVVVSRNAVLSRIFADGLTRGEVILDVISPEKVATSQAGNFRHRRDGLRIRLADDLAAGLSVPQKRVVPGYDGSTSARRRLVRQRRAISRLSLEAFAEARTTGDYARYTRPMRRSIARYRLIDALQRGVVGVILYTTKRLLGR